MNSVGKMRLAAEKLPASAKICDTLVHYKSLVPADNTAFQEFAKNGGANRPAARDIGRKQRRIKGEIAYRKRPQFPCFGDCNHTTHYLPIFEGCHLHKPFIPKVLQKYQRMQTFSMN